MRTGGYFNSITVLALTVCLAPLGMKVRHVTPSHTPLIFSSPHSRLSHASTSHSVTHLASHHWAWVPSHHFHTCRNSSQPVFYLALAHTSHMHFSI